MMPLPINKTDIDINFIKNLHAPFILSSRQFGQLIILFYMLSRVHEESYNIPLLFMLSFLQLVDENIASSCFYQPRGEWLIDKCTMDA